MRTRLPGGGYRRSDDLQRRGRSKRRGGVVRGELLEGPAQEARHVLVAHGVAVGDEAERLGVHAGDRLGDAARWSLSLSSLKLEFQVGDGQAEQLESTAATS